MDFLVAVGAPKFHTMRNGMPGSVQREAIQWGFDIENTTKKSPSHRNSWLWVCQCDTLDGRLRAGIRRC